MYYNLGHSEFSWKEIKIGKLLGNFIKLKEIGRSSGYPVHSFLSLLPSEYLHKVPRFLWILIGLAFVVLAGVNGIPMSIEFSHWIFYLIPIFIVTFFSKRRAGIVISTVYALALFIAEISSWFNDSHLTIPSWSAIARLASLFILTFISSSLKTTLQNEKLFSRMDSLTGVGNRRYLNEWVEVEIHRSQRYKHPFTIIYIDLDDFKIINDHFGHSKGDHVLREVAQAIQNEIRSTDRIARLGGDEFIVLLPRDRI